MADIYHDPLTAGVNADANILNRPLYQLDDALRGLNDDLTAASVEVVLVPYTPVLVEADYLDIPLPQTNAPHLEITAWVCNLQQFMAISFNKKFVTGSPDENYLTMGYYMDTAVGAPLPKVNGGYNDRCFVGAMSDTAGVDNPSQPAMVNMRIRNFASPSSVKLMQVDAVCAWNYDPSHYFKVICQQFCWYNNPNPITSVQISHSSRAGDGTFYSTMLPPTGYIIRGYW